jgi:outer membrane cobalamin receptor
MNKIIMTLLAAFCSTIALAENVSDTAVFKNVSLDNVVVTGSRNQVDVRHLPFTVTPISRQQIEYRYTPSLLTVMNELVPGYFSTSRGIMGYGVSTGAAGGMTIRGIGGSPTTGMMVLIDGHPQYAGLMGHPIADAYQSFLAEKVEVLRGPASVLYGSNAMGGVVNIVTRRMLQNGVKTNARIGFGSFGTLTTEASNMTHFGRFSSIASLSYNRTDGHRTNSDFNQAGGYLKLAYLLTNNWTAMTDLNLTHFNASNPGTVANPMTDNDQHITRGVWSGGVENDYGWTSGAVKFYYNWGVHKINDGYGPSTNNNAPRNYLFHSRDHVWGINAYQSFILMEGNRTTFGIDYQGIGGRAWNDYDSGNTTNLVDTTEYEVAGYVDFRQNIGDILTFDAGARWDHHSQAGNEFIPQAGLVAHLPSQLEMKATVSKGFRNPTLQNLFMFRPKNPDLKAERVWNYEIAVSQHLIGDRLYWGANVYLLNGDNMIQVVAGRNENTGEIKNWGIELASNYRVNDHWFLNANYSFIHAKYDVVATPKHKLYGGADFSTGRWLLSTGVQWINHLTTQVTPITTASYVLWNARVTYKVLPWLNIYAIGENLLAQKYEVNYGYPMPRATMIGGVDISL